MKKSDDRKIAIYSRKSKFTGKGDSIENQIELCRKYIAYKFQIEDHNQLLIFEDEGFSGKDTNRPRFQEMLNSCRKKEIKAIVCYRLDRISRNISDFAVLYKELEQLDIEFCSVNENFETSNSMGKAMMYLSSVFAQLERDVIAERIRDNMLELAKSGRWLGGTTPLGYQQIGNKTYYEMNGHSRISYHLKENPDEISTVQLIFNKFLELNSLTKLETYLMNHFIKSRKNNNFSRFALRSILNNPVYAAADKDTLNYFSDLGTIIYHEPDKFDGRHGLMVYNKTDQASGKSHKMHDYCEWIVAVGKHPPLISGKEWIKVQSLLEQNKSKSYRKPKNTNALLSGLLFCADCGNYMRPKTNKRVDENGNKTFSYLCETKDKSRKNLCDIKNPQGNLLDKMVCDEIKRIAQGEDSHKFHEQLLLAKKQLLSKETANTTELDQLQKAFRDKEQEIRNLVLSLSHSTDSPAQAYINTQINALHEEKLQIEHQIENLNNLLQNQNLLLADFDILIRKLSSFSDSFDMMTIEEKRATLRLLIDKVIWDGTQIHLYLSGSTDNYLEPNSGGCK